MMMLMMMKMKMFWWKRVGVGRIRRFARMLVRRSDGTLCLLDHLSHPVFLQTQMYYKQTKRNSDYFVSIYKN